MGVSNQYQRANETGVKTQNTEWLASDLVPAIEAGRSTSFRLTFVLSLAVVIEITFDSGATWIALNSGSPYAADNLISVLIPGVDRDDTINFRTPTSGGVTLDRFIVDSLPVGE